MTHFSSDFATWRLPDHLDLQRFREAEQISGGFCLEFGEVHQVASK